MSHEEENKQDRARQPRMTPGESKRLMRRLPDQTNRPVLNLDLELFGRNNVALAVFVVLSTLVNGSSEQQKEVLRRLKPDYLLGPDLIYGFLFRQIAEELNIYGEVDIPSIVKRIPDFGPEVFGEPTNEISLKGDYANFAQILYLKPTASQIAKAIDMVETYAKKRGWAVIGNNSSDQE